MFSVRSVCLSVCLSVRRITRKLVNGFDGIFWRGRALVAIRIRESKVRNPDLPDRRRFVLSEHISS